MTFVLITGGCGFIGSNFVRYVHENRPEWHLLNLDLLTYAGNPENLADLQGDPHYTFIKGDVADWPTVQSLFHQYPVRRVVHFAAETHVDRSILDPSAFVRTNVLGTFNLLEAARLAWKDLPGEEKPRFLHISTDEVYGSLTSQDPAATETSTYAPSSPYAASKASADWLARSYFRTYQFPVLITNCSNNYGPYQFPEKLLPLVLSQALEGKPIPIYGTGGNVRDWLYVEDHCRAVLLALEKGELGECYNIAGKQETTNLEVVRLLLRLLKEIRPELGPVEDLISFVPDRPGHDWRYALDIGKIEKSLGWRPQVSLEEGLRRTISWYLSHLDWLNRVRSGAYQHYLQEQYGSTII